MRRTISKPFVHQKWADYPLVKKICLFVCIALMFLSATAAGCNPLDFQLTLLVPEGEGTLVCEPDALTYKKDTAVVLRAEPAEGWTFKEWNGDVENKGESETTIVMDRDRSVQAVFTEDEEIIFPDKNLERAVRQAIKKNVGKLYISDVKKIDKLMASSVRDIEGIQHLVNLWDLDLSSSKLLDLSKLSGLKKLQKLDLWANNYLADISPIKDLTELRWLRVSHTHVVDISALTNLNKLEELRLAANSIVEVKAIAGLVNLKFLDISGNNIEDISPLAENKGLDGSEKVLLLDHNYIDLESMQMGYINTWIGTGMEVRYEPQMKKKTNQ